MGALSGLSGLSGLSAVAGGLNPLLNPLFGTLRGWYDFFDTSTLYQESGTGSATTAVANVADPIGRIVNKVNGGLPYFYATSDSARPTRRAFGTTYCARFDGTDDALVSSDTNYWKFLHTSGGACALIVFYITDANPELNQVLLGNNNNTGGNPGIQIRYIDASTPNDRAELQSSNGSAALFPQSSDGTVLPQTRNKLLASFSQSSTNGVLKARNNGTEIISSTSAYTFSSSNPNLAVYIGITPGVTFPLKGDIAQILLYETPSAYSNAALLESLTAPTT